MEVLLPLSAYNISITGNNEKRVFEKFSKIFIFQILIAILCCISNKDFKKAEDFSSAFCF